MPIQRSNVLAAHVPNVVQHDRVCQSPGFAAHCPYPRGGVAGARCQHVLRRVPRAREHFGAVTVQQRDVLALRFQRLVKPLACEDTATKRQSAGSLA